MFSLLVMTFHHFVVIAVRVLVWLPITRLHLRVHSK